MTYDEGAAVIDLLEKHFGPEWHSRMAQETSLAVLPPVIQDQVLNFLQISAIDGAAGDLSKACPDNVLCSLIRLKDDGNGFSRLLVESPRGVVSVLRVERNLP